MARALISSENGFLRNVAGFAIAMLVIPIAIIVKLIVAPFEKPIERSPAEVLNHLRDFRDGTGDDYDWDDFVSVPIADPELEVLRASAASLDLPFGAKEFDSLRTLIARAEAIAERPSPD